jgi:chromosome segregation ATPase
MKDYKAILIALLAGITIFSGFKYIFSLKEQYALMDNVQQLDKQVAALEGEKKGLIEDLDKEKELYQTLAGEQAQLKSSLTLSREQLSRLTADWEASQKTLEDLNSQFSAVRAENTALREQIQSLNLEMTQTVQDKDKLQARLGSIAELKKAIKELRQQMHEAKKGIQLRTKTGRVMAGNQGFLTKNGKFTHPSTVRIEVEPLPNTNP